ncbi:MAG: zinc-dependent alcohol dehydrogenase family protein [Erysipelotrichaceae bacterium]|nr:zinc-dependent alcohol dehydrogenase family protein [Erysipelotrichaceae bacterium]
MKALVLYGPHDLKVAELPEPELQDDGVKIAVHYCGLCGTDIHKYHGRSGSHGISYPVALGHEISGVVEAVGRNVTDFRVGDRVTADPNYSCGRCYYCRNGMPHMCENARGVVKGMAEYVCPPQQNVYHLPDRLSLRDASMTEPLSCVLHGLDQLDVKTGSSVLILGLGAIGTMMLEVLSHQKTGPVIVVETQQSKKALAERLGADLFIDPLHEDVTETIRKAGIRNVDRVIECVGARSTIENAMDYAGRCAVVVLFGLGNDADPPSYYPYEAFQKELTIRNSYLNPLTVQRAVDLLADGYVRVDDFLAGVISMEEMHEEIMNPDLSRKGKVIARIR